MGLAKGCAWPLQAVLMRRVGHERTEPSGRGPLQQRIWIAEDGSARSTVEALAEELGPSLRRATATPVKASRSTGE
jgi:hypothetical protein